jgi:hypothetical protein
MLLCRGDCLCPLPFPTSPNTNIDRRQTERLRKRDKLPTGRGGGGGRGAESYDRKKAWSSINHAILSGVGLTVNMLKLLMCARG